VANTTWWCNVHIKSVHLLHFKFSVQRKIKQYKASLHAVHISDSNQLLAAKIKANIPYRHMTKLHPAICFLYRVKCTDMDYNCVVITGSDVTAVYLLELYILTSLLAYHKTTSVCTEYGATLLWRCKPSDVEYSKHSGRLYLSGCY
jgi:hypothetical protein